MIKLSEHKEIAELIRNNNDAALFELKTRSINMLRAEQAIRQLGNNSALPHNEIEKLVEIVVKIEAYETGMGWLARTKRRLLLVRQYGL
jgi:hypothetical protein